MKPRRLIPLFVAGVAVAVTSCSGADDGASPAATAVATEPAPTESKPASTATPDTATTDGTATDDTATDGTAAPADETMPTTPPATEPVDTVTWALYREPNTLDPIYAFDYPENTTIAAMCESVLRQEPDGTIVDGLASIERPDETTIVLTVRDGVSFWDGTPLTAEDVAFSLQRQSDPALGGFYGLAYALVTSIEVTAPNEVTIKLSQPDYWIDGTLSSLGGIVVSKAFVEQAGPAYGTPAGGVMCTGAYSLANWATGDRVSLVANPEYWDGEPLAAGIDFVGVPDEATLTSALLTGDVDGSYLGGLSGLDTLRSDANVTVSSGPSYQSTALIVSNAQGPLGDVRVRQALSMALDRQGIIDTLYKGEAQLPRTIANPGSWSYAPDVFEAAWDELPEPVQDVDAAKAMIDEAGAAGQKIVIATTNEIASAAAAANVVAAAAEDIGLEVELQSLPAATYISLFTDPAARAGVDGFFTVNYSDSADPAALYATFALPYGLQNYSGYQNADVTRLLEQARGTADPEARAELVVEAQAIIMDELPWIGLALPTTVLATGAELTGAPTSFVYMFSPWANGLGGLG